MKQAGIDGVALQRFLSEVQDPRFFAARNQVTRNVQAGAEAEGRVFAIEYDVSGVDEAHLVAWLEADWKYLVDTLEGHGEPALPQGRRQAGAVPVGPRVLRPPRDARRRRRADRLAHDERRPAVPRDAGRRRPGALAHAGRRLEDGPGLGARLPLVRRAVALDRGALRATTRGPTRTGATLAADLAAVTAAGKRYMPVVFPGFSWHNLHGGASNQIPRRGGAFYWRQVWNAVGAGATMLKTAMFDEVDEGTAMFKLAPTAAQLPTGALAGAARRRRARAAVRLLPARRGRRDGAAARRPADDSRAAGRALSGSTRAGPHQCSYLITTP